MRNVFFHLIYNQQYRYTAEVIGTEDTKLFQRVKTLGRFLRVPFGFKGKSKVLKAVPFLHFGNRRKLEF